MVRYCTFGRAWLYFEWKWRWTRLTTFFGLMPEYQQPEWETWANMCSRDFCNFVDHSWLHYLSNKTCLWWNSVLWIFFELFCVYVCVCVCIAANLYHLKSHLAFQTLYFALGQLHWWIIQIVFGFNKLHFLRSFSVLAWNKLFKSLSRNAALFKGMVLDGGSSDFA